MTRGRLALIFCLALPAFTQTVELGSPPVFTGQVPQQVRATARQAGEGLWIDTSDRSAVRDAYLNDFLPTTNVPMDWTGGLQTGDPGDTSAAYKQAAITRVNFMRALAGLPPWIHLNLEFSRKAQQAALMMSANKMLDHFPPESWLFYTADGAEAAQNSNLCLSFNLPPDPGCVQQYIDDQGHNNTAVGHRRWILNPATQEMGTGDVPQTGEFPRTNSLWVFDSHIFDPRPATRDEFVAWPPPGYVPEDLVFDRWSFAFPGADFTGATVTMQRGGQAVALTVEPQQQGFGENAIVWVPEGGSGNTARSAADLTTNVTVSNVVVGSQPREFTYQVISFDPASVAGPALTSKGLVNSASFTPGTLTPDSWADLFAANIGSKFVLDSSFPTVLDGVEVEITDGVGTKRDARLHFVTTDRVQFLTPSNMAPGNGKIDVRNSDGASAEMPIVIARVRPGFFAANASGQGPAAATWVNIRPAGGSGFTFTVNPPPNRVNDPVPVAGQVFVSFFGTGFRFQSSGSCRIGGIDVPVTAAVAQGQFDGLDQMNVGPIPPQLAGRGNLDVECFLDGIAANVVTVAFR